jgi:hypothetical protein
LQVKVVGTPKYLKRRVTSFPGGFVEQHTSQLTGKTGVISLEVCLVAKTNAAGLITLLEEYLDPSPFVARSPASTRNPPAPSPAQLKGTAQAAVNSSSSGSTSRWQPIAGAYVPNRATVSNFLNAAAAGDSTTYRVVCVNAADMRA